MFTILKRAEKVRGAGVGRSRDEQAKKQEGKALPQAATLRLVLAAGRYDERTARDSAMNVGDGGGGSGR